MAQNDASLGRSIRLTVDAQKAVADFKLVGDAADNNFKRVQDGAKMAGAELVLASDKVGAFVSVSRGQMAQLTNIGYQISDFSVQVAGGTSALRAFTQQAPQMLGALGPVGAIAGTAAAVLGALAGSLLNMNNETNKSPDALANAAKALADNEAAWTSLKKQIVEATQAQREFLTQNAQADLASARKSLSGQVEAATGAGTFGDDLADRLRAEALNKFPLGSAPQGILAEIEPGIQGKAVDIRSRAADAAERGDIEALLGILNASGPASSDAERKARDQLVSTARSVNTSLAAIDAAKQATAREAFAAGPGGGAPGAAPFTLPTLDVTASSAGGGSAKTTSEKVAAVLEQLRRDQEAISNARQGFIDAALARLPDDATADDRAKIISAAGSIFDARALDAARKQGDTKRQAAEAQLAADRERDQRVLDQLQRSGLKLTDPRTAAQDAAVARLSDSGKSDDAVVAKVRALAAANFDAALAQDRATDAARINLAVKAQMRRMDADAAREIDRLGLSLSDQTDELRKNREELEKLRELGYIDDNQKALGMMLNSDNPLIRGGSRGIHDLAKDWTNLGDIIEKDTGAAIQSVSDKLTDFVMTGKLSLADLGQQFLRTFTQQSIQYGIGSILNLGLGAAAGMYGGGAAAPAVTGSPTAGAYGMIPHAHTGGLVGQLHTSRMVDPELFHSAKRLHGGGPVLQPDEVPIVALQGERVLSRREAAAYGQERPAAPTIHVDARGAADPALIKNTVATAVTLALRQHTEAMRRSPSYRAAQRV